MGKNPYIEPVFPLQLSEVLRDLKAHMTVIGNDVSRAMGVLDKIFGTDNVYELRHLLMSLYGREQLIVKHLRRYEALMGQLHEVTDNMG